MPAGEPIAKDVPGGEVYAPAAEDRLVGTDDALFEGRRGDDDLEGRAGRILTGDGGIDQRTAWVFVQALVVAGRDTTRKQVVVVARQAHQRQDFTRLRYHRDGRAVERAGPVERLLQEARGGLLQPRIHRENDRVARLRFDERVEHVDCTPDGINLHLYPPRTPTQVRLGNGFQPRPADHVVALVLPEQQAFEALGRDQAGVADEVPQQRSVGIVPNRCGQDGDARQEVALFFQHERGSPPDVRLHPQRLIRMRAPGLDALGQRLRTEAQGQAQPLQHVIEGLPSPRQVGGPNHDAEVGDVSHELMTVAVVGEAAQRLGCYLAQAVVLGTLAVAWPVGDLQVPELIPEHAKGC